jgi:hypothetical protein
MAMIDIAMGATVDLWDVVNVVLTAFGVVLRDFIIIDVCKCIVSSVGTRVFTCASSNFFTTESRSFWVDILVERFWASLESDYSAYIYLEICELFHVHS